MKIKLWPSAVLLHLLLLFPIGLLAATPFEVYPSGSMEKIRPDGSNLQFALTDTMALEAARDEVESFQLTLVSQTANSQKILVRVEPFPEHIRVEWFKVGYVKTANPSYPTEYVGLWPDPLFPGTDFQLRSNRVQTLWFNVAVSPGTPAGIYHATVFLRSENYEKPFKIVLRVRNFVLPRPGSLAASFGLYPEPLSKWYLGSSSGKALRISDYKKWLSVLVQNRITPKEIGNALVKSDPKTGVIDASALRQTIGAFKEQLPPYSYFAYRFPNAGTIRTWLHEGKTTEEMLTEALRPRQYFAEWNKLGLPLTACIYGCDEPETANTNLLRTIRELYDAVHRELPDAKIMQTIGADAKPLVGAVNIWCPKTSALFSPFFQKRVQSGDTLWTYVCCSPIQPYANFFIDRPAVEARVLFWMARKAQATGFLYWATDWYDGIGASGAASQIYDPEQTNWDVGELNSYKKQWVHVNGDGLLLYPGRNCEPLPSIRLFVIRDGIEDYEYISVLRKLISQVESFPVYRTPAGRTLMAAAKELTEVPSDIVRDATDYTHDPEKICFRRRLIGNMIEQLNDVITTQRFKEWKK